MASLVDVCRFNPSAGGTTDWTFSTAVQGYQGPTAAGAQNGATYSYRAESADLSQWEIGQGAYNSSTGVIARTTVLFNSSGTTSKINFSATPQVALVALAEDLRAPIMPQGRLTLTSGAPVMTSNAAGATTLYYTPAAGRFVPIWNGSYFVNTDIGGELSQATTDATKSPAAVAATQVYDIFVWSDAGTIRATRGPTWASGTGGSNTARGTGAGSTTLSLVNGILVNSVAITNGPAAGFGTYVGTVMSDASSQLNWVLGGSSLGGTAAVLGVWNAYNRVNVCATVQDTTSFWTYGTAAIRAANGSNNNRVTFVSGRPIDSIEAHYTTTISISTSGQFAAFGVAMDSTSAFDRAAGGQAGSSGGGVSIWGVAPCKYKPVQGIHFIQAVEYAGGNNVNFNGQGNQSYNPQALDVALWM